MWSNNCLVLKKLSLSFFTKSSQPTMNSNTPPTEPLMTKCMSRFFLVDCNNSPPGNDDVVEAWDALPSWNPQGKAGEGEVFH